MSKVEDYFPKEVSSGKVSNTLVEEKRNIEAQNEPQQDLL